MPQVDTLIRNARIVDGSDESNDADQEGLSDVAILDGRIVEIIKSSTRSAKVVVNAEGYVLAPGFIDTHTHDDTNVIRTPEMLPKLSQGVTTVIVGNCGISAAPATLKGAPPDPMNLLGGADVFSYPTYKSYISAIENARPAVNVAALIGHTTLRNNYMDRLDRAATAAELEGMRAQLIDALQHGALGLSSGLAYLSAHAATRQEVETLAQPLAAFGALYTTHLRSETEGILDALAEAFEIGRASNVPIVVSHLKCAGVANWGRSSEVLSVLQAAAQQQRVSCDCYPYAAGSSTLDLRQVDERVKITITWSEPHPEVGGRSLAEIANGWGITQIDAATRLQPAGAIYHSISEQDMRKILEHPLTMIGSDGLPNDPHPHPRLWGTFPRVLGVYCREEKLFPLRKAIYKMTSFPASKFRLHERGLIKQGYIADLVLFNPETIRDTATFDKPISPAQGIVAVWVNGTLSYHQGKATGQRAGHFLPNGSA